MLNLLKGAGVLAGNEAGAERLDPEQSNAAVLSGLYQRYARPVYRYAYSRTGNQQDAEDLTEQVFMDALEGLGRYEERGQEAAWLFTIARRRVADFHRRRSEHLPFDETLDTPVEQLRPEVEVSRRERLAHLDRLLASLDDEQQELLRLRFAADLTYAEIGQVIDKSEAAVKMAMSRLLTRLRGAWHLPAREADDE
jgi:RNA polymerase sigma-70 factor (ECF subfamily)